MKRIAVHFDNVFGPEWTLPAPSEKTSVTKCFPVGNPKPGSIELLKQILADGDSSVHLLHTEFDHPESLRLFFVKRYLERCGLNRGELKRLRFQSRIGNFEQYITSAPGDTLPFFEATPDTEYAEDAAKQV